MVRILALGLLFGCNQDPIEANDQGGGGNQDDGEDITAPSIDHTAIEGPLSFGEDIPVPATVTDDGGITMVLLYYKTGTGGSNDYFEAVMVPSADLYTGYIEGDDHYGAGMWYYIAAVDTSGNEAYWPQEGIEDPQYISLTQ